jgi:hypothetical protein
MKRYRNLLPWGLIAFLGAIVMITPNAQAAEVGYVEDYALAKDRNSVLKQLIPGTEDYYYYQALQLLNTEQFDKIEELTRAWYERHNQTPRLTEIQTRFHLLTYDKNPQRALNYLTNHFGIYFNHQKEVVGAAPNLPIALDPKTITRDYLKAMSFGRWGNLENFEDSSLDWLASENLTWERRRNLLQRLQRPDIADLPKLIHDDLNAQRPSPFGSFAVHNMLTIPQLEALLKLRPELINDGNFARVWITKLQPNADSDWRRDKAIARAFLNRMREFVAKLPAVHNALKAHVIYHLLALDRSEGKYDPELFMEYVKLPRFQYYMEPKFNERIESQRHPASLNVDFSAATLLPAVNADEPLVRSYLKHFLLEAASPKDYAPYIESNYLNYLFVENKVENGLGDPEAWAAQLPPEQFAILKSRIDIDFAFTNKVDFTTEEAVRLDLFVKNVPSMLVKVYEINTTNYYRTQQQEVGTDINLDGLVANSENVQTYTEAPLLRKARRFEFPQLSKPGVYVIDFIGNGKSSRALIRKGRLRPISSMTVNGQSITVVDEASKPVPEAKVWLSGNEYKADKTGRALVPFTAQPGRRNIVLTAGDFSSLDQINHLPENYRLVAGLHVDRESLLTGKVAPVIVRPSLYLNDQQTSTTLLKDVHLRIVSTDHSGISSTLDLPNFKLFEDRESVHEFRTPPRLHTLSVSLTAKVDNLSSGAKVELSDQFQISLNEIERTDRIEDLHLTKNGQNYLLEVLGRTGEAKPDRPVYLSLKHRDFREQISTTLKTAANGRVTLGTLQDIVQVTARGPEGTSHTWNLPLDKHTYRRLVHAKAGEAITLPYLGKATQALRTELALFEVRNNIIATDKFDAVAVKDGVIELKGLDVGDYVLHLKTLNEQIRIRITTGETVEGHILGKIRQLQTPGLKPVQIQSITDEAESVVVKLRDVNKFVRLHVFATRYLPAFDAFDHLSKVRDAELGGVLPTRPESVYLTGRNIGDEYRYVLDRRGMKKHPGNMLERPQLLLNPWAIRSTETGEQQAAMGDDFGVTPLAKKSDAMDRMMRTGGGNSREVDFANLDYLAKASEGLLNLVPDEAGLVKIPRKLLGAHSIISLVLVDPLTTTTRTFSLPEQVAQFVDLRLKDGLDPNAYYTQQKQVTVVNAGQPFVLQDISGSRFEAYDSLPKVYNLLRTLSRDPKLDEFSFLMTWPKLKDEEKRALYSKNACHELSFFIFNKDKAFFESVVKPYLMNKKDKTFLDHWLLGNDVSKFSDPWHHSKLNMAERVLLAQKLAGEPAKTHRHLSDLLKLLPANVGRELFLFDTALSSEALGSDNGLGLGLRLEKAKQDESRRKAGGKDATYNAPAELSAPPSASMPAAPGIAGGLGGMPGGGGFGRPGNARAASGPASKPEEKRVAEPEGAVDAKEMQSLRQRDGKGAAKKQEAEQADKQLADREYYFKEERKLAELQVRQLYRRIEPTMEWAENNYYKLRISQQVADLIPVSAFWAEYAKHDGKGPFLSRNLADASRNFSEMILALAVLDLPFEAGKHQMAFDGGKMQLGAAGPIIAFHEEVRKTDAPDGKVPVLVGQNYYRQGDRFREENGEKIDKYVTGEFLVSTVYGCQVVVTNPTSARQRLNVLVQLPVGAIPVANGQFTKSVQVDLEPYRTQTVDYLFYFPLAGRFTHFPAMVAKSEKVVAAAKGNTIDVVDKLSKPDTSSWDYISQNGTDDEVIGFLNRENVNALNLDRIAFRMKDKNFFEKVITLLKDRHTFQPTLWSYALQHNSPAIAKEYLLHNDRLAAECGGPIDTPLFTLDPVARFSYEHLEYKPLVNARAHSLGSRRQIVNAPLHQQYHGLLKTLTYRKQLDDTDLLAVTYYLLLQDRVDEAQEAFNKVNPDKVATRMQYDYCQAYLALFLEDVGRARAIAMKYANYPVDKWRNLFSTVISHVDEAEGKGPQLIDKEDKNAQQGQLAATEPGFEAISEGKNVVLSWQNLDTIQVNYYLMDVELLFSRTPFAQQSGGQFAFTKPANSQVLKLPAGQTKMNIALPEELVKRNVLVEFTAVGKTRTVQYFANVMDVKLVESYGQVKVTDPAAKPLSKVYVKVYCKLADGTVKFHKDGYTDIRGRFDYATVSTPEKQPISKFSVLVLSEDRGAVIREANPPQE